LDKAEASAAQLQCGPHAPLDSAMAKHLLCQDIHPSALHNNCSGKHAGMLLACRYYDWPLESYLEPDHPLQQAIRQTLIDFSGETEIVQAIDGCGAPVFAMPLEGIARLFSNLAIHPHLSHLYQAMITHPDLVGDAERIDSQLMKMTQGNLVAKVGAEGMLGIGNHQTGEGLVLKAHDGSNAIRDRLVIAMLKDLGWITDEQAEILWALPAFSKYRDNTQGKVVGHYEFVLPWEQPPQSLSPPRQDMLR